MASIPTASFQYASWSSCVTTLQTVTMVWAAKRARARAALTTVAQDILGADAAGKGCVTAEI